MDTTNATLPATLAALQVPATRLSVSLRASKLGRGAFAEVHAGRLDGVYPVALKRANSDAVSLAHARRELLAYAHMSALRSVPRLLAYCATPPFTLVLERLPRSLRGVLATAPPCASHVLALALALTRALADVHAAGVAHGDIKPENVLFSATSASPRLADFGLARRFTRGRGCAEAEASALTLAPLRGTPAYLAPESWGAASLREGRVAAQAADVYALAMVLFQLESRRAPWEGKHEWGVFAAVVNERRRPEWHGPEQVDGFRAVVERAWNQLPALRPTAAQLAQQLLPMQRGHVTAHCGCFAVQPPLRPSPAKRPPSPTRVLYTSFVASPLCNSNSNSNSNATYNSPSPSSTLRSPHSLSPASSLATMSPPSLPSPSAPAALTHAHRPPTRISFTSTHPSTLPTLPDPTSSSASQSVLSHASSAALVPSTIHHNNQQNQQQPQQNPTPPEVHSLQYAFKREVQANDLGSLCEALLLHDRNPAVATSALEAMAVLLDRTNLRNSRLLVKRSSLLAVASILSRYGRNHFRLCKSACVVILLVATCHDPFVEKHLRTSAACELVLNCIKWHPASLPVVQTAAYTLGKLAEASPQLSSIVAELGGIQTALRALSRSFTTFDSDQPVALAALNILQVLAASHPEALIQGNVINAVSDCCDNFHSPIIDDRCVSLLYALVKLPEGTTKAVATKNCILTISRLIDRSVQNHKPCAVTLKYAFHIVSEIARSQNVPSAAAVFMSTSIVPSVMESKDVVIQLSENGNLSLIIASFECLTNMTALGTDVCGSMQMSHVFEFTRALLEFASTDATVALRALLFIKAILHQLTNSSYRANVDIVRQILLKMQQKWKAQPAIVPHVRDALLVLEETCGTRPDPSSTSATELPTPPDNTTRSRHPHKLFSKFRHAVPRANANQHVGG